METVPAAAAAAAAAPDPPARTFSQVAFTDIPYSYPPSKPIICRFTLNSDFQSNTRDWVGIFKVGWSSTRDYHTFVWVEVNHDAQGQEIRQAAFKEYYLPKDETEFYQFCYVDNAGQVRGASTAFCFRSPSEQNMESTTDDDMLVITTQEQVEQSQREKAELQKQLDLMRAENQTLKSSLQSDAGRFKEGNEQREAENAKLLKEMDQLKEHNERLKHTLQQQMKENDRLKEEMMIQMTKQMEIQRQDSTEQEKQSASLTSSRSSEERYNRAVMKINQLKEEREELKGKLESQSDEIAKLKGKLRETERELSKTSDSIQLLQVDLQSTNKEKERLSAELQKLQGLKVDADELKRENQELCRRLSQQGSLPTSPQTELRGEVQSLSRQLQDAQVKLAAEKEETRTARRQAEYLEKEMHEVKEQLKNLARGSEMEERRSGKYEMQLRELNALLADKDIALQAKEQEIMLINRERDELTRENQELKGDIERLRSVYTNTAPPAADEPSYLQPDIVAGGDAAASRDQQDRPAQPQNIYETIDSLLVSQDEPLLVCHHCQESFPGITQQELEQHEQSHRVCPFCTMICDNMEQAVFEDHVYSHEL
uniref:Calcium binding and coiled-coil domain 2 n=1 Tax=Fundulus heteroclitus TaxID=8078 RepID=A0A146VHC8_FUNHE